MSQYSDRLGIINIISARAITMPEPTPQESDAVLGKQNPPPKNAVILGGFVGIKAISKSQSASVRMQVLTNAIEV